MVAELLEGEGLREQLNDGALSQRKVIDYAQQIASGLAAAHAKGIVHRDLKPENLFVLTDGRIKILDFGLAKLRPQTGGLFGSNESTQMTMTEPGTVMGTVEYMSPEQVRGQEADHRADIFAFGVILYEMLSGRRPFTGESAVEVMNAILKEEPAELSETQQKISPALDKFVRRCLEKKPEHRFQSASDLSFALEALFAPAVSPTQAAPPAVTASVKLSRLFGQSKLAWAVATALLLITLGMGWAYFTRRPTPTAKLMKFSLLPPEKSSFGQIALSPDGGQLAFTAATGGKVQLWVRALDATEARPLPATQGATLPFWSPDSRFIGFFADGRLKKIEAAGGPVQTLCEVPFPFGGTWSRDGVILCGFGPGGLLSVSATGGEVTQVTVPDRSRQELFLSYPTFLPDGRHFLYIITSGQKETRGVYLGSLDGTVKRRLLDHDTLIKYMAANPGDSARGGWLVFERDGALLAQPFDTSRFEFTGEPFTLSEKVGNDLFNVNDFTFSISDNGVLVFDPSIQRQRRQYLWRDRRNAQFSPLEVAAGFYQPCLSPDEKRFITDRLDPQTRTYDLWLYDASGGNPQRFTFDPANDQNPIWSPDGSRIVWASNRDGKNPSLYQKEANLTEGETLLLKSDYARFPTDWSRDGRFILYQQIDPKTKKMDVWVMPVNDTAQPFLAVGTEANEVGGALSPDGRWLAYASDVSGRFEVWVQSFPGGGGKWQVSINGGAYPRWRQDGKELFYYAADGKVMAATVRSSESFKLGEAISLFEFRAGTIQNFAPYAVTADGQRFLINAVVETETNAPLTVVINWTAGLGR
jgi:Tol biopolymer transport system component